VALGTPSGGAGLARAGRPPPVHAASKAPRRRRQVSPIGYNWVVQDERQNTYDACRDGTCNFQP